MHDVTLECVAAVTDHFADAFVRENVVCVYMTLWRRNDVRKLTLTPFCFEKSSVRKRIFNVLATFSARFMLKSGKICNNNDHTCLFHCINTCRVPRTTNSFLNNRTRGHLPASWGLKCILLAQNQCMVITQILFN